MQACRFDVSNKNELKASKTSTASPRQPPGLKVSEKNASQAAQSIQKCVVQNSYGAGTSNEAPPIQFSPGLKRRSANFEPETSGKKISYGAGTSDENNDYLEQKKKEKVDRINNEYWDQKKKEEEETEERKKEKEWEENERLRTEKAYNDAKEFCDIIDQQKHKYDREKSPESDKSVEILESTSNNQEVQNRQINTQSEPDKAKNLKNEKKSILRHFTSNIASIFAKKSLFGITSTRIGAAGAQEMKTKDFNKICEYFKTMDYTSGEKRFSDYQILYLTQLFACAIPGTKNIAYVDPAVFTVLNPDVKTWIYNFDKKTTAIILMAICHENHWRIFFYNFKNPKLTCVDPHGQYEPPNEVIFKILKFLKDAFDIQNGQNPVLLLNIPSSLRQPLTDGWSCGMRGIDIIYLIMKHLPLQEYPNYNAEKQRELYIQLFKHLGTYSSFPIDFFGKMPFALTTVKLDEQQPSTSTIKKQLGQISQVVELNVTSSTSDSTENEETVNGGKDETEMHETPNDNNYSSAAPVSPFLKERQQSGQKGGTAKALKKNQVKNVRQMAQLASVEKRRAKSSEHVSEEPLLTKEADAKNVSDIPKKPVFKPPRSSSLPFDAPKNEKVTDEAKEDLKNWFNDALTQLQQTNTENESLQNALTVAFNQIQNTDFKSDEFLRNIVEQLKHISDENQQLRNSINDAINQFNKVLNENQLLHNTVNNMKSQLNNLAAENQKLVLNYEVEKAKVQQYIKDKRNLTKRIDRRELPEASATKSWKDLTTAGQKAAIKRIKNQILSQNPMYSPAELAEIINQAFPTAEVIRFSEKETLELKWQADIRDERFEITRKIIKRKLGHDIFASKRQMLKYRKRLHEECPIDSFTRDEITGAVLRDVVKAIVFRVALQKKCGTYLLEDNEPLKLCFVSDQGGDHTSLGLLFSSLDKRNSPDAMLLLGVFKGKESRENLELAFEVIETQLKNVTSINVNGQVIQVEFFKTADLKMLKTWRGIRAGNAKHSCIVCILPNDKTFAEFKDIDFEMRTCEKIDASICQDELPFFSFVKTDHIILPGLHLFLGIVMQIIKILFLELRKIEFEQVTKKVHDKVNNEEFVDENQGICNDTEGTQNAEILDEQNIGEKSDNEETDDEKLEQLQMELEEAEDLAKQWTTYCDLIEASLITNDDGDADEASEDENSDDDDDDDEEENIDICAAQSCIVKKTGVTLPARPSHGVQATPYKLKYKKQDFHTICVGMNNEDARKQKKKQFVAAAVSDDVIKQTIKDEATASYVKVNAVKAKLEKEFFKDMAPEKDSRYVKILEKVFQSFGASRQVYYQTYTGNHIHFILQNASLITGLLVDPETGKSIVNKKIEHCCTALEILSRIQSKFAARMLSDAEIQGLEDDVNDYKAHMKTNFPEESVTHKNHKLLRHVVPYAKKWKTLNFFSEAPIEHQHHINKQRLRLISTRNESKQCEFLLQRNWEHNIARDQGRVISDINIF